MLHYNSIYFKLFIWSISPQNKYELFNLRHAQARNVIEHIFGVLKRRFRILLLAPEYNLQIQGRIPLALIALYNFIRTHDSEAKFAEPSDDVDYALHGFHAGNNYSDISIEGEEDHSEADNRREAIADAMWTQYQSTLQERLQELDRESSEDEEDSGECSNAE